MKFKTVLLLSTIFILGIALAISPNDGVGRPTSPEIENGILLGGIIMIVGVLCIATTSLFDEDVPVIVIGTGGVIITGIGIAIYFFNVLPI